MNVKAYPEPTIGTLIFNQKDELLLIKTHKWKDQYVIPGGHIELGEKMEDAARREAKEETGLEISDLKQFAIYESINSDNFHEKKHFIFIDFSCRANSEDVKLNNEAYEYKWVNLKEIDNLPVEPFTQIAIRDYFAQNNRML
jgi:nucleoside triphosphatase